MSDTTTLLDDPTSGQYYRIVDLPPVETLTGDEVIEVVQDGESRQASLSFLKGAKGDDGLDAYDVALEHGFEGSAEEWLAGLKGKSAYEIALDTGFDGDVETWLESLKGINGIDFHWVDDFTPEIENIQIELTDEEYNALYPAKDAQSNPLVQPPKPQYRDATAFDLLPPETDSKPGDVASLYGTLWFFRDNAWHEGPNLIGPQGKTGPQGPKGDDGLKGDTGEIGSAARVVGSVEVMEQLPLPEELEFPGDMYLVGTELYAVIGGEWAPLGDLQGPEGMGLRIKGTLPDVSYLPVENNDTGDAYIINKKMYVWDSEKWSETGQVGPKGDGIYELALATGFEGTKEEFLESMRGEQGLKGDKGEKGEKGDPANMVNVLGNLSVMEELPEAGAPGDAWYVGDNLVIWTADGWLDKGPIKGQGIYELAVEYGFEGTEEDYLQSLVGAEGGIGPKGDKGDTGETGPGLRLVGQLLTEEELPGSMEFIGDAYLIAGDTHVFGSNGWFNAGPLRGPQGIQGAKGDQGLKGDTGAGLKIVGEIADFASLPQPTPEAPIELGTAYGHVTSRHVYIYGLKGWFDAGELRGVEGPAGRDGARGIQGIQGPRGYTGYTGPRGPQGLRGEKGDRGLTGPTGPTGKELIISGRYINTSQLPSGRPLGTAYIIYNSELLQDRVWIMGDQGWFDSGILQGPKGDQGPRGTDGTNGLKGDKGDKGDQGKALNLLGKKNTVGELPSDTQAGYAWMVGEDVYFMQDTGYVNLGPLRGPKGDKGEQGLKGDTGDKGAAGDVGAPIRLMGERTTADLLPEGDSSMYGYGYLVGAEKELYVFSRDKGWMNCGKVGGITAYDLAMAQLPEDQQVDLVTWLQSLNGEKGERGDSGASIVIVGRVADQASLPASAGQNEGYLIGQNFWLWTGTEWQDLGVISGPRGDQGEKGEPGMRGVQGLRGLKGDRGASILLGDYDPSALDGAPNDVWMNTLTQGVWLKATTTLWNHIGTFGGGNVYSPAGDKPMVRVGPDWVELEVKEAPKDGKNYVRRNGQWVVVDRYDLAMISSTGEVDAAVGNTFVMENGTAGTRALSFKNLPANRAMTLVVFVRGNTGNITWPAEVKWNNTLAPTLSTTFTNLVFFWTGTEIIGSTGASA